MKRLILCAVVVSLLLCSCKSGSKTLTSTQIMMNTSVTITINGGSEEILAGAVKMCCDYEKMFSRTIEGSDTDRINTSGGNPVSVSNDTAELLRLSLMLGEKTDGAFDVTVTPLIELWDVVNNDTVPDADEILKAKEQVDYKKMAVDGNTVTADNVRLDFGAIAKGYISDRVREYLQKNGVTSATINLGGNIVIVGDNGGDLYSVGIQKPFERQGVSLAVLMLTDKTAVTSGIYERYFKQDGHIYHHIIDTETGYPVDNEVASVTVIADSSALADGLSTSCLALGKVRGAALVEEMGAEAVFIDRDGSISVTKGLSVSYGEGLPEISLEKK